MTRIFLLLRFNIGNWYSFFFLFYFIVLADVINFKYANVSVIFDLNYTFESDRILYIRSSFKLPFVCMKLIDELIPSKKKKLPK